MLGKGHALAEALASGLRLLGWRPRLAEPPGPPNPRRVVLVEDESGRLPTAEGRWAGVVVAVGDIRAVEDLIGHVARGARAVDAALPYECLLKALHDALRAASPTAAERDLALAGLRARLDEARRISTLTEREAGVLAGIAAGYRAEDIARDLSVSVATVRSQIAAVLRKLDVRSQTAAAATAHRCGPDFDPRHPWRRFHQNCG
ncbi:LuxR C-terminal-related transcriptional regulator [Actinosynnema sp. NPDC002837]